MTSNLLERLQRGEVLVADGAMGTILMDRGLAVGDCPEAFNLDRIDLLTEIASAYLDAGAELIGTNTFGGSPLKLGCYHLEARAEAINRQGVSAAKKAVGDRALVMASCGPTGRILEPYGDTAPSDVYDAFLRQARALVAGGADAICVETMTDLEEAVLAVQAAREVSADIPILATMTFDKTRRGFFTIMGVTIEKAAKGLLTAGANVIGSNCGNGVEAMVEIAREFKSHTEAPIIIQSNAGLPQPSATDVTYPETPGFMADKVGELLSIGVSIVGGCCGTTPAHIRAFRKVVDAFRAT